MDPDKLDLKVYLTEVEIAERVQELGEEISQDFYDKRLVIVSVLTGAFIFTSDLIRNIDVHHEIIFTKIKSYDGIKSGEKIEHELIFDETLRGKDILIIEDIVDTGKTLDFLINQIAEEKPNSISIATLLWKPDSYQLPHKIKYVGFSIPNEFVIGYGMDYNDFGRNLRDIYIFKNYKK